MCVLLVEDDPSIRLVMADTLRDAGFDVMEASSGDQAIELIHCPQGGFTALVTDYDMPGHADGFRVAEAIRRHVPTIPVLIVTGRPEVFQSLGAWHLGYQLLTKPFLARDLVGILRDRI